MSVESEFTVLHQRLLDFLKTRYPLAVTELTAGGKPLDQIVIPTLLSPEPVQLKADFFEKARKIIRAFGGSLFNQLTQGAQPRPPSVLMSYDFHIDQDGELKLIEINTNASMSLFAAALIEFNRLQRDPLIENTQTPAEVFLNDFSSLVGGTLQKRRVAIVDDTPENQKLYAEFVLYKEEFAKLGAEVVILSPGELVYSGHHIGCHALGELDLIYNRSTDFYFEQPDANALKLGWNAGTQTVISPNPNDYDLLAKKSVLVDLCTHPEKFLGGLSIEDRKAIESCLIPSFMLDERDIEEVWKIRKEYIFKPTQMYGGKAVYRGASMSRKAFEQFADVHGLAQKFIPAPTLIRNGLEYKYDLRFFAFKDEIRLGCARLYQGQMTNATTPGGGVTAIDWRST